jgi:hypothetical protein
MSAVTGKADLLMVMSQCRNDLVEQAEKGLLESQQDDAVVRNLFETG